MANDESPAPTNYPRSPNQEPSTKSFGGMAGAFALLGMAVVSCCCGGVQLLAEGPHGPHGEITNDPSIVWMLPLFCGLGVVLAGTAIWLAARSLGWRRKP